MFEKRPKALVFMINSERVFKPLSADIKDGLISWDQRRHTKLH